MDIDSLNPSRKARMNSSSSHLPEPLAKATSSSPRLTSAQHDTALLKAALDDIQRTGDKERPSASSALNEDDTHKGRDKAQASLSLVSAKIECLSPDMPMSGETKIIDRSVLSVRSTSGVVT